MLPALPELVALHLPAFLQEHSQVHLHALEDQVQHQCAAEDVKQLHHIWVVQPFQERDLAHGTDWNAVLCLPQNYVKHAGWGLSRWAEQRLPAAP